jgi:hypothetical protein
MRTLSLIRTAALVVALAVTALPSQGPTTMIAGMTANHVV